MIEQTSLKPAVVITGASSGIGRELALCAAQESVPLVLVARSAAPMHALAADIVARKGEAHVLVLDITAADAGERIDAFLAAQGLYCDILVNNAGYGLLGAAATLDRADQLGIVDLNIHALTNLTLRYLPGMLGRGRGGILNVASVASFLPGPNMAIYYASKAYVRSFSEAVWEETRGRGVTISCLCPGPVQTAFFDRAGASTAKLFKSMGRMDARTCAQIGWDGFRAGKRVVVTGLSNRLATWLIPFVPKRLLLLGVRKMQKSREK